MMKRMIKALGDVFVPILPAIVASGLMMGLVEALGKAIPSFAGSDWYGILDLMANTAFIFLPVLIAVSATRVFGGNIFLGAVIGMIMIHPSLINAWSVGSMDAADIPVWRLLGFPIRQVGYQGHVIPVVIAVWLMCRIEKWLHKHVPEMIDLFVTPFCTVLITAFLTLGIIGPVFSMAETYVLDFAGWIITVGHGIGAMIMGALYPLTVVCGIHHMYNVIEAGMLSAADGQNIWMPIASAANFAQGAACLAVGLKARKLKTKSVAIPSSLSAALGITEPAIFGVNLRFTKPLICGMAGGAAGALTAESGEKIVFAPVKGNVIQREEIPDGTFASGVLGDGVGIEPVESEVVAPFDGEISSVADTFHAIGITGPGGMEVLIHVGVDTVNMKGDGFELFVSEGDKVKAGQKLISFDMEKIKAAGYSTTTAVLLTNSDDYTEVQVIKYGKTGKMEKLLTVEA